jgi:hypothetical protein
LVGRFVERCLACEADSVGTMERCLGCDHVENKDVRNQGP